MWEKWRPGLTVIKKRIRISGNPGQHNEARNYFDGKFYKLPAGLIGVVQSITPFKIEFDKSNNGALWSKIAPPWSHSKMYASIEVGRLSATEVET